MNNTFPHFLQEGVHQYVPCGHAVYPVAGAFGEAKAPKKCKACEREKRQRRAA